MQAEAYSPVFPESGGNHCTNCRNVVQHFVRVDAGRMLASRRKITNANF
jgi:hypothetical protein